MPSILIKTKLFSDIAVEDTKNFLTSFFKAEIIGQIYNIRVFIIETLDGPEIIYKIKQDEILFNEDFLKISQRQQEVFNNFLFQKTGVCLIGGGEKTGKTKALYSFLESESQRNLNIFYFRRKYSVEPKKY